MQNEIATSVGGTTTATISGGSNISQNPFLLSPKSHIGCQFDDTSSFYYSMFQPYSNSFSISPSDCSYDDDVNLNAISASTEDRLNQASLVLEYQQLYNSYTMCLAGLQESMKEVEALRLENESLRLANTAFLHQLSLVSQATVQNCLLSSSVHHPSAPLIEDFRRLNVGSTVRDGSHGTRSHAAAADEGSSVSPTSVIEQNRLQRRRGERVPMPKSISVRSSGYVKSSHGHRVANHPLGESQRVHVPGGKIAANEALEFDVFNQGMTKTELCNKWQETGTCPYGDNCQFAHGVSELRPVIRHPRYKTEVCRMVLAGNTCPYGHRCHFRHSLTDQETLMARR